MNHPSFVHLRFAFIVLAAMFANACVRKPESRCEDPGYVEEECANSEVRGDFFPTGHDHKRERYIEVPADPNESATNSAPNWLTTPVTFQEIEFKHFFPSEQVVWRSIPFYLELPSDSDKVEVVLRYKPFGEVLWKKLQMKKHGSGRFVEIPCLQVNTIAELRYFFEVSNIDLEPIGQIGSRKEPLIVQVRDQIKGG